MASRARTASWLAPRRLHGHRGGVPGLHRRGLDRHAAGVAASLDARPRAGRRRLTRLPMGAGGLPALGTAVAQTALPGWEPALPVQRGMILNYLRYPDDGVDVIQATLDWASPLEPEPFEAAWRLVVRRHQVLRTAFRLDDEDGLVQMVDPDAS